MFVTEISCLRSERGTYGLCGYKADRTVQTGQVAISRTNYLEKLPGDTRFARLLCVSDALQKVTETGLLF